MCFSLTEKGNPYIVRKKDSEAENSEHLSEINEPTSGFGYLPGYNPVNNPGHNPHIQFPNSHSQHQAQQLVYNPIMQQCVIPHGYNYPFAPSHSQGHPHLKNLSNPWYQTNTWHNTPAHISQDAAAAHFDRGPAEIRDRNRSFLEGERSYENEKKKFTADEWSEKKNARYAMRESYRPFREPANWPANYDNRPPSAAPISFVPFVSTESSRERNLPMDSGETLRSFLDELPAWCRPRQCPPAAPSNAPFVPSPLPRAEPRNYDHPPPPAAPIPFINPAPIQFVPFISPAPPRQPHGHINWGGMS
jgi:hypothetical protein